MNLICGEISLTKLKKRNLVILGIVLVGLGLYLDFGKPKRKNIGSGAEYSSNSIQVKGESKTVNPNIEIVDKPIESRQEKIIMQKTDSSLLITQ